MQMLDAKAIIVGPSSPAIFKIFRCSNIIDYSH